MCRIAGGLLQLLKEMLYILGNALIHLFVLIVTKKQKKDSVYYEASARRWLA